MPTRQYPRGTVAGATDEFDPASAAVQHYVSSLPRNCQIDVPWSTQQEDRESPVLGYRQNGTSEQIDCAQLLHHGAAHSSAPFTTASVTPSTSFYGLNRFSDSLRWLQTSAELPTSSALVTDEQDNSALKELEDNNSNGYKIGFDNSIVAHIVSQVLDDSDSAELAILQADRQSTSSSSGVSCDPGSQTTSRSSSSSSTACEHNTDASQNHAKSNLNTDYDDVPNLSCLNTADDSVNIIENSALRKVASEKSLDCENFDLGNNIVKQMQNKNSSDSGEGSSRKSSEGDDNALDVKSVATSLPEFQHSGASVTASSKAPNEDIRRWIDLFQCEGNESLWDDPDFMTVALSFLEKDSSAPFSVAGHKPSTDFGLTQKPSEEEVKQFLPDYLRKRESSGSSRDSGYSSYLGNTGRNQPSVINSQMTDVSALFSRLSGLSTSAATDRQTLSQFDNAFTTNSTLPASGRYPHFSSGVIDPLARRASNMTLDFSSPSTALPSLNSSSMESCDLGSASNSAGLDFMRCQSAALPPDDSGLPTLANGLMTAEACFPGAVGTSCSTKLPGVNSSTPFRNNKNSFVNSPFDSMRMDQAGSSSMDFLTQDRCHSGTQNLFVENDATGRTPVFWKGFSEQLSKPAAAFDVPGDFSPFGRRIGAEPNFPALYSAQNQEKLLLEKLQILNHLNNLGLLNNIEPSLAGLQNNCNAYAKLLNNNSSNNCVPQGPKTDTNIALEIQQQQQQSRPLQPQQLTENNILSKLLESLLNGFDSCASNGTSSNSAFVDAEKAREVASLLLNCQITHIDIQLAEVQLQLRRAAHNDPFARNWLSRNFDFQQLINDAAFVKKYDLLSPSTTVASIVPSYPSAYNTNAKILGNDKSALSGMTQANANKSEYYNWPYDSSIPPTPDNILRHIVQQQNGFRTDPRIAAFSPFIGSQEALKNTMNGGPEKVSTWASDNYKITSLADGSIITSKNCANFEKLTMHPSPKDLPLDFPVPPSTPLGVPGIAKAGFSSSAVPLRPGSSARLFKDYSVDPSPNVFGHLDQDFLAPGSTVPRSWLLQQITPELVALVNSGNKAALDELLALRQHLPPEVLALAAAAAQSQQQTMPGGIAAASQPIDPLSLRTLASRNKLLRPQQPTSVSESFITPDILSSLQANILPYRHLGHLPPLIYTLLQRIEDCYDQFRQVERQRKKTEAELARCFPGRRMSSSNTICLPRLPHNPTRLDRLVLDHLREHARVITLVAKMERIRNAPLQPGIHKSLSMWQSSVTTLATVRHNDITNGLLSLPYMLPSPSAGAASHRPGQVPLNSNSPQSIVGYHTMFSNGAVDKVFGNPPSSSSDCATTGAQAPVKALSDNTVGFVESDGKVSEDGEDKLTPDDDSVLGQHLYAGNEAANEEGSPEVLALSQCLCSVVQATRGARTALFCALTLTTLQHFAAPALSDVSVKVSDESANISEANLSDGKDGAEDLDEESDNDKEEECKDPDFGLVETLQRVYRSRRCVDPVEDESNSQKSVGDVETESEECVAKSSDRENSDKPKVSPEKDIDNASDITDSSANETNNVNIDPNSSDAQVNEQDSENLCDKKKSASSASSNKTPNTSSPCRYNALNFYNGSPINGRKYMNGFPPAPPVLVGGHLPPGPSTATAAAVAAAHYAKLGFLPPYNRRIPPFHHQPHFRYGNRHHQPPHRGGNPMPVIPPGLHGQVGGALPHRPSSINNKASGRVPGAY